MDCKHVWRIWIQEDVEQLQTEPQPHNRRHFVSVGFFLLFALWVVCFFFYSCVKHLSYMLNYHSFKHTFPAATMRSDILTNRTDSLCLLCFTILGLKVVMTCQKFLKMLLYFPRFFFFLFKQKLISIIYVQCPWNVWVIQNVTNQRSILLM